MKLSETENFKIFFNSFLAAALWSSVDGDGEPLDNIYRINDITGDGLEILKSHALSFFSQCYYYVALESGKGFDDLGHDFWLTSARHGAGFWDGDWPKYGEMFTGIAEKYPLEHIDLEDLLAV